MIDASHDKVRRRWPSCWRRAHERHLVGLLCHLRKDAADLDAGHVGLHGADDAAELGRCGHLRVECLDVSWTAAEPEPDDGRVAGWLALLRRAGASPQQIGQHEAASAQTQRADFEEVAASGAFAVGPLAGRPDLVG
jgi:hypothetical protein